MNLNPNGASGAAVSPEEEDLLPRATAHIEFQLMSASAMRPGGRLGEQI